MRSAVPPRSRAARVVTRRHAGHRAHERPRSRLPQVLASALILLLIVTGAGFAAAGLAATTAVGIMSRDLPDPAKLESLTFPQPTIVYDRTGKVALASFQREQRSVVQYDQVPKLILDATTTAEDRTFWQNGGYDLPAIVSAVVENAKGGTERGASTITQQLVRARLLPDSAVAPGTDRYERKVKELIQSMRLTEAFPGEPGKERIISAYLNEIYYGHRAYGIAAAARMYFGVDDLSKLTTAEAALLAALPKSPTTLDPYRYAKPDEDGRLIVPSSAPPVVRRDWILSNLSTSRWTRLSAAEVQAAIAQPVILSGEPKTVMQAPHFSWQVRRQLDQILGGPDAVETGGYRVITTLDWKAQQLAEKWVTAATIVPNLPRKRAEELLKSLKIPASDRGWVRALRGKDLHNAALVALDYRTGDVMAYVGSAGYDRDDMRSAKFEPQYDAAGDATRQPGSAWKPILYATAFEQRKLTPGSLLLDITTEFAPRANWVPRDADKLDRGPVLVRRALQQSLNVPAIRALERVGNSAVADEASRLGIRFAGGKKAYLQSGLAGAIGTVEVRPLDLTAAYGALGNGGVLEPPRMILEIRAPDGHVVYQAKDAGKQALSPQAAYLMSDILKGNTNPHENPAWAAKLQLRNGPHGTRRVAAAKTGTANDARDLATYGYLAPPKDSHHPGLAVGIWMGNSDHSNPRARKPAISLTAAAPLWHAFVRDLSNGWPTTDFARPKNIVSATIDSFSGGAPGPWTKDRTTELFIAGTEPGGRQAVDPRGLLYSQACHDWRVDPVKAELGPSSWIPDVEDWARRARRGPGVEGQYQTKTAYLMNRTSWGGKLVGPCEKPKPKATHRHRAVHHGEGGHHKKKPGDGGGGHGGGHDSGPQPAPTQTPAPSPSPTNKPRRRNLRRGVGRWPELAPSLTPPSG
ncbi:MAG: transglycosylase domain-containing protein [Chloroflexota bacterium]